ncbi:MAG: hypothetical protein IJM54_09525 [Thermoguttaceae bacterium]|nr:hypothetical protein [Thermoguttaceae bacterium]
MDTKLSSNWARRSIVIRKRTLDETRDLSLRVLGKLFKPLLLYYLALALPIYAIDALIWAAFMPPVAFDVGINSFPYRGFALFWNHVDFLSWIYVTVWLETSFVGSLATQYLGIWLFNSDGDALSRKNVVKAWKARWFQLAYYLIVTRIIRTRFFYAETILLEQTPFRSRADRISTSKRVRNINNGSWGTFFGNLWSTETYLCVGVTLGAAMVYFLVNSLVPDLAPRLIVFDLALFPALVFGCRLYYVAYSFFSYVNYRIVSEGWDLDLAFKVEATKHESPEGADEAIPRRFRRSRTLAPMTLEFDFLEKETSQEDLTSEEQS